MPYLLEAQRIEIRRYLLGQIKSEGGWGMYASATRAIIEPAGALDRGPRLKRGP